MFQYAIRAALMIALLSGSSLLGAPKETDADQPVDMDEMFLPSPAAWPTSDVSWRQAVTRSVTVLRAKAKDAGEITKRSAAHMSTTMNVGDEVIEGGGTVVHAQRRQVFSVVEVLAGKHDGKELTLTYGYVEESDCFPGPKTQSPVPNRVGVLLLLDAEGRLVKVAADTDTNRKVLAGQNPQATITAVACLRRIQAQFEPFKRKYHENFQHLGPGVINERDLSLHFPVTGTPKVKQENVEGSLRRTIGAVARRRALPVSPAKQGLFVKFTSPLSVGRTTENGQRCWPYSDVGFRWYWMWPNGVFPMEMQQEFARLMEEGLRPMDDAENAAIQNDLARRETQSYVLRGRPGVELTARFAGLNVNRVHVVDLYEKNLTDSAIALHPGTSTVVQNSKLHHGPLTSLFLASVQGGNKDPFLYLKPGESRKTGSLSVGRLPPGKYKFRIVQRHARDGWEDVRPTYHDGSPVVRQVKNAWAGVVVSNQFDITVPPETDEGNDALPMLEGEMQSNEIQVAVAAAIDLGKNSIQFEGHKADDVKPELLPVGPYARTPLEPSAKEAFLRRQAGKLTAGPPYQELVGRMAFPLHGFGKKGGSRLIVDRFERRDNQITAVVKVFHGPLGSTRLPKNAVYLRATLPSDLPAGRYHADIGFGSYGKNASGDLIPLPGPALPGLHCEFEVPAPLETLQGTVLEKPWTKSFESWNAGGSEYYVLKEGNVQLRPTDAVPLERFKHFKDKQVVIRGRHVEGTPYTPPAGSDEQMPGPPESIDGKPLVLMRGRGFAVHQISLATEKPPAALSLNLRPVKGTGFKFGQVAEAFFTIKNIWLQPPHRVRLRSLGWWASVVCRGIVFVARLVLGRRGMRPSRR